MTALLLPAPGAVPSLPVPGVSDAAAAARAGRSPLAFPDARRPAAAARRWAPGVGRARAYARRRSGTVSFTVLRGERAWSFRGRTPSRSASVVKVMLLAAYLRAPTVRDRRLGAGEIATLTAMITRSDNDAATGVHRSVGGAGLSEVARRAGLRSFAPSPAWGVSRLTAADGARLMLSLERILPRRHRTRALALLAHVTPSQRWGIADAAPRGWRLHFKGGWDPAPTSGPPVDHQVALLRRGRRRVAVAILVTGARSQADSEETQRGVAARLLGGL